MRTAAQLLPALALILGCGDTAMSPAAGPISGIDGGAAAPPTIILFETDTTVVELGAEPVVHWRVENAAGVRIFRAGAQVHGSESLEGRHQLESVQAPFDLRLEAYRDDAVVTATLKIELSDPMRPPPPEVILFEVAPQVVVRGGDATLSWKILNATAVQIDGDQRGVIYEGEMAEGQVGFRPVADETFKLVAHGPGGQATATVSLRIEDEQSPEPSIVLFEAIPPSIRLGASTFLRWQTTDAAEIRIEDGDGTTVFSGVRSSGEFEVHPQTTTTFVLVAAGAGGRARADVEVTVLEATRPEIASFEIEPGQIELGASAEVAWRVQGMVDSVEVIVTSVDHSGTVFSGTQAEGAITVTPEQSSSYELVARGPGGEARATSFVIVVQSNQEAVIDAFTATPDPIRLGETLSLSWSVMHAGEIRVSKRSGTPEVLWTEANPAGQGTLDVVVSDENAVYELWIGNGFSQASAQVEVRAWPDPVFDYVLVSPYATDTATIAYRAFGAEMLETYVNGVLVDTRPVLPPGETFSIPVPGPAEVTLRLTNPLAEHTERYSIGSAFPELEPNDSVAQAQPLAMRQSQIRGHAGLHDEDWYRVSIPEGGAFGAIFVALDGFFCEGYVSLELYEADGQTLVVEGQQFGFDGCGSLTPAWTPELRDMPGGVYYLRVVGSVAPADYLLEVRIDEPSCGNGRVETRDGESCDDGNLVGGDGCTASCQVEIFGGVDFQGDLIFSGQALAAGASRYFVVDLPEAAHLTVQTFAPTLGACANGSAIGLALMEADGRLIQEFGSFGCSVLDGRVNPLAQLAAGRYLVRVYAPVVAVAPFAVSFLYEPFVCGNGYRDPGEACDDGDIDDQNSCRNDCTTNGLTETEPNNSVATSNTSTLIEGLFIGVVEVNDSDLLSIEVRDTTDVFAVIDSEAGLCFGSLGLELLDASGTVVAEAPTIFGGCPLLDPEIDAALSGLAPGTYYLRLYDGFGVRTDYQLRYEIGGPAVCGDGRRSRGESCDDGNRRVGDLCGPFCEPNKDACGDGFRGVFELCDDGNRRAGDGCSAHCRMEGVENEFEYNDTLSFATPVVVGAPGSTTVAARAEDVFFGPSGFSDYYQVEVPVGGPWRFTVGSYGVVGDPTSCLGDLMLELVDAAGIALGAASVAAPQGTGCPELEMELQDSGTEPAFFYVHVSAGTPGAVGPGFDYVLDVSLNPVP